MKTKVVAIAAGVLGVIAVLACLFVVWNYRSQVDVRVQQLEELIRATKGAASAPAKLAPAKAQKMQPQIGPSKVHTDLEAICRRRIEMDRRFGHTPLTLEACLEGLGYREAPTPSAPPAKQMPRPPRRDSPAPSKTESPQTAPASPPSQGGPASRTTEPVRDDNNDDEVEVVIEEVVETAGEEGVDEEETLPAPEPRPTTGNGLSTEEIRQVFAAHLSEVASCYETIIRPMGPGTAAVGVIRIQVLPSGAPAGASNSVRVHWVSAPKNRIGFNVHTTEFDRCVVAVGRQWRFPASARQTLAQSHFHFNASE